MKSPRLRPRRYRLKAASATALQKGHPWVYRDKVSAVTDQFADGQWLQLLDPREQTVGYGIYHKVGGVAIRMLRRGAERPDRDWLHHVVRQALGKRTRLLAETDAYRLLNGENDSLPGIVLDVYADYGVLQTYSPAVDSLGRYVANIAYHLLHLKGLVWKYPRRRLGDGQEGVRVLRGVVPDRVSFHEGALTLCANLHSGQKSGTFLDLRGLRRWLQQHTWQNRRVLNLFAYTGMLGLACCQGGAQEVVNVDAAQPSLDFGAQFHGHPAQRWLCADIFVWLKTLPVTEKYHLIVVDPPSMAWSKEQVGRALATYERIYRAVSSHLHPGGTLVACCCTSRISPSEFDQVLARSMPSLRVTERLPMEPDHQARYEEAEYLKIVVLKAGNGLRPEASAVSRQRIKSTIPRRPGC